ncbi:General stress protein 18 [Acaryochloris thomasi RCC1774]|uniref:General stress protein 18 n=1 Tax=Acaryochloris thomasi RCC1774 TaxID=1764569 RepID=A0A2W1JI29_9CYAN|nr:type 1 glutamine amidotransferase domain-containing protein [Acaryochloris thomasi]PZD71225.1 General stress protein 18 [Acaryochloris thomasi RCC1774]
MVAATGRIAILLENQFEDSEFQVPYTALLQASADVKVIGTRMNDEYEGKQGQVKHKPHATATEVRAEDFDAVIIPGGGAPDQIRTNPHAVRLVTDMMEQGKLVAAVCHGPQVLIEADQLREKRATGFQAIRKDIENAGATYVDQAVVVDGNLITSRRPADMPLFTAAILRRLELTIPGKILPDPEAYHTYEWWPWGELWNGASRQDIISVLNKVIVGERYTLASFKQYDEQATDADLSLVLREITATKERHVELLEQRLRDFEERVTWQAAGTEAYAKLLNWIQSSEDVLLMRRALGDLQTGRVDVLNLSTQVTDPWTADLLEQIGGNLARHEDQLAELYRGRQGNCVEPPMPTTVTFD